MAMYSFYTFFKLLFKKVTFLDESFFNFPSALSPSTVEQPRKSTEKHPSEEVSTFSINVL
jgi:hypothetical protein